MADAHATNHDFHILNPSPWPAVGAASAFVMAIGAIVGMRSMNGGEGLFGLYGPYLFLAGLLGVLCTMFLWWRDCIREVDGGFQTPVVQIHLRYGMILFIASEVMFFVAWFWAYFDASLFPSAVRVIAGTDESVGMVVRDALTGGHWPPKPSEAFQGTFDPWGLPLLNTLILLTSGTTVTWAHHALLEGNRKHLVWGLAITVVLGAIFTLCQAYEYGHAAFNYSGHIYGATFFMATGFHGFHVIVGTIFLAVCLVRAIKGHFTERHHFGFEAAAWYWHFVDVVWLFLFICVYVIGAGTPASH